MDLNKLNPMEKIRFKRVLRGTVEKSISQTNANITANTNRINSINAGPKGIYTTLAQLQAAHTTGDSNIYIVTGDIKEVETLTVTAIPTTAGNITITLNGTAVTVALTTAMTTTALVAAAIAGTTFNGWTVTSNGAVVTFTKQTSGTNTAPTFNAGATGSTATMTVTIIGIAADYGWYYWNSSVWTRGATYQGALPADNSVTKAKLYSTVQDGTDLMAAKNLCDDINTSKQGYFWIGSTGSDPLASYSVTVGNDNFMHYTIATQSGITNAASWNFAKTYTTTSTQLVFLANVATTCLATLY